MNIYFDMEFTGLHKNTTPISIGLVTEKWEEFYAEFTDYNKKQCDKWIKENVLDKLKYKDEKKYCYTNHIRNNSRIKDNFSVISLELRKWLKAVSKGEGIQFVSDVCHYDMVLLIDIITHHGTAFDLPENISPVCHDINQDIARCYGISDREAFEKSREEIIATELHVSNKLGDKHNSLYDARVIQDLYKALQCAEKFEIWRRQLKQKEAGKE